MDERLVSSIAIRGTDLQVNLATQVGRPFNPRLIEKDVRDLWSTGQFEDIRVETVDQEAGTGVIFQVVSTRDVRLHEVRIEPSSFGLRLSVPEGTPVNRMRAHEIALEARKQLDAQGYINARVDYALVRCARNKFDLRLTITASPRVRVKRVEFAGNPGINSKELQGALRALRIRRMFRSFPAYSAPAVNSDLARILSVYLSKGYRDASARLADVAVSGAGARLTISVQSGPHSDADEIQMREICSRMLAERRNAERQGILDFSVSLHGPDLKPEIYRGQAYRVSRINFTGSRHYKDLTIRRNLALDESQPLDPYLLRKSLARLNRTNLFEPLDERNAVIRRDESTGEAGIRIHLTDRKRGAWSLSGPVGPPAFAGPARATLSSRLSTYMVSASLLAFAHPILPMVPVASRSLALVFAVQRPFSPGEGWKSGFVIAPQLGWQVSVLSYASTQLMQRLLPALAGDRGLIPVLPITVERQNGDAVMFCEPPPPKLWAILPKRARPLMFPSKSH